MSINLNFFSEGVRDFKTLFDPLERAKVQFESVWNSVNMLGVVTDHLDQDRFAILHKRAERAFLGRLNSKTIFKTLQVSQFATLPNSSEVLVIDHLSEFAFPLGGLPDIHDKFTALKKFSYATRMIG